MEAERRFPQVQYMPSLRSSGYSPGTRVVVAGYPGSMAMSIKNERVAGKIRELAQLLETDQVTAVERAVDALSEQVSQSVAEGRLIEVLQLAHAIREGLSAGATLNTDDLYDDQGLPR